jgi:hypothetical protein
MSGFDWASLFGKIGRFFDYRSFGLAQDFPARLVET